MKHLICILLALVMVCTLCACIPQQNANPNPSTVPTNPTDEIVTNPTMSTTSTDEALTAQINTDPVNMEEMTTEELNHLAEQVFTCARMPSNLEWHELVSLTTRSSSSLAFMLENVDLGINVSGSTAMKTSLPLENLQADNIRVENIPQWMSCVSSCFERTYGTPIWWSMWADPEEDNTLQMAISHIAPSLLYSHIAEYTGSLMEAYPDLPVFEELPDSATEPDMLMGRDDPRLLKVGHGPEESFLLNRVRLHPYGGDIWCEFTTVYDDNQESWFTPLKNMSIPIFSTEFVECDENTINFLKTWASPVVG